MTKPLPRNPDGTPIHARHVGATPVVAVQTPPGSPEIPPGTVLVQGDGTHARAAGTPPEAAPTAIPLAPPDPARAALYAAARAAALIVPCPPNMAARPLYGHLPIPFTTPVVKGVPDFRSEDPSKVLQAIKENRCGLCGRVHGYWTVFLTTPLNAKNTRLYTLPPYHPECIEYALLVCPWLRSMPKQAQSHPPEIVAEFSVDRRAEIIPEALVLGTCRGYTEVYRRVGRDTLLYAHAEAFKFFHPIPAPETPVPAPVLTS